MASQETLSPESLLLGKSGPGLVINELVGNAKPPKELFKKWTDLAGICLRPSSQPPLMPGAWTQCQ